MTVADHFDESNGDRTASERINTDVGASFLHSDTRFPQVNEKGIAAIVSRLKFESRKKNDNTE